MSQDIKLNRLCRKGATATLIQGLLADWQEALCILDAEGRAVLGEPLAEPAERHPIAWDGGAPLGWVVGGNHAPSLAALVAYAAQKELEGKLLAQETLGKYKELTLLYDLGEKIAACLDSRELARLALDEARRLLPRGKEVQVDLWLREDGPEGPTLCAGHGDMQPVALALAPLDGVTRQVLTSGTAEIVDQLREDPRYQSEPGDLPEARSLLCAPLKTGDRLFGTLTVAGREPAAFSAAELKVLNLLAAQVAMALGRVHLIQARVAQERLRESLKLARDIQMGMLSTGFPRFASGGPVDLYALMEAAREVSGDFYDFFHVDADTLLIVIGDVSDKGVPAALFMVMTKTLLRAIAKHQRDPARILDALNSELCRDNDSAMFVTLFLATLDLKTGRLAYSFGGHNQPLLLGREGGARFLTGDTGTALGIIEGIPFVEQATVLEPGDGLLLYTDGVSEAMDVDQAIFGDARLCQLMDGQAGRDGQALVDTVIGAVREFAHGAEQSDDITLLALRFGTL